jgi:hypothetical protein
VRLRSDATGVAGTTTLFEHECTTAFGWTERDLVALDRLNRAAGIAGYEGPP